MNAETAWYTAIVTIWVLMALPALMLGLTGRDPFGRAGGQPKGTHIPARTGWFLMELPALVILPVTYVVGTNGSPAGNLLVGVWTAHYSHRTLIWPWLVQRRDSRMPLITCAAGFTFNVVNGVLFSWYMTRLTVYTDEWLGDSRFMTGATVMAIGAALNVWSDYYLARLRNAKPDQAVQPMRGPFRLVSCPNLTGEMLEWAGFALMCWSPPAMAFAVWTAANLTPRALWRLGWYHRQFDDYPSRRRALIPGLL